jgi:hypothetical protein
MTQPTYFDATATVFYTQAVNSVGQVLRATVFNNDVVARQITLFRVPVAGSPGANNTIMAGQGGRLLSKQSAVIDVLAGATLDPGDTVQGLADAGNMVVFTMSGYITT